MARLLIGMLSLLALLAAGCADDGDDEPAPRPAETADPPAEPPPRWRTVRNREAGFTVSVPRSWRVRMRRGATLVRAKDRLAVVTLAADRSRQGLALEPAAYARQTIEALPGFEGSLSPRTGKVRGSPYRSAVARGQGTLESSPRRPQRIAVAAFRRPRLATYVAVVFRNARARSTVDTRVIARMLRSVRAQPAATSP